MKLLLFLSFLLTLAADVPDTPAGACWKEIQAIDKEVHELSQEKERHIELSRQYQEEGDNWLYISGSIQDGYRNWAIADDERKQAAALEQQIDRLLERKARIYQYYPELNWP
jgi:hypothetical protein